MTWLVARSAAWKAGGSLTCGFWTGAPPVSDFGQLQRPQSSGVLMVRRGDDHLIGVSFVHRPGEIGRDPVDNYIIIIY